MKRFVKMFAVLVACVILCAGVLPATVSAAERIDNSKLIPAYVPNDKVQYVGDTVDWAKDLILAQFRIETATEEGTLEAAVKVLDHYAEMGVNGLMILPIADRPLDADGNGYNNWGPDTIWSKITGTTDYEAGWKKFKTFVDEAHKRNLRVIVDIITWGIGADSPVYKAHPEWFSLSSYSNGKYKYANCRWKEKGLIDHWSNALVEVAKKTGLDGYRCDCEPFTSGYTMYGIVRDRAYAENGQKLLIMSETVGGRDDEQGYPVYDLEQWGGVTYHDRTVDGWGNRLMENRNTTFIEHYNIVDAIKTEGNPAIYNDGKDRLYVNMLSCHDNSEIIARGERIYMGYQGIFAPFIPMWFIGEEWNNPDRCGGTGVLYFNNIDWSKLDEPKNRAYFEDIKRMIRVRRQYAEVFTYFPDSVRDANICKVTTNRDDLQAYARWYGDTAVLIVPNTDDVREKRKYDITVPWEEMGLKDTQYVISDAYTGKQIAKGTKKELATFSANVASLDVAAFVISPAAPSKPTTTKPTTTTPSTTTPPTTDGTTATTDGTTANDVTTTVGEGDPTTPTTAPSAPTTAPTASAVTDPAVDDTGAPVGLIIGIVVGAVVLIAAAVTLLLILRKRKNA